MSTETYREALALYPFDGSDPNLILALHAAFRAGAEFAAAPAPAPAPAPSVVPEAAVERAARAMQAENAPRPEYKADPRWTEVRVSEYKAAIDAHNASIFEATYEVAS